MIANVLRTLVIPVGLPAVLACMLVSGIAGQTLEPRTFANSPVGMNFGILAYGFSHGNVLLDPALPVEDATADVNSISAIYVRSIGVFGMSGRFGALLPVVPYGKWQGQLSGIDTSTTRSGIGDPALFFSVNLLGAPALRLPDFVTYDERAILGVSVFVGIPLGQYDGTKLVNLGSNRWTIRPRVGGSYQTGRWTFEGFGSVWLFTNNPDRNGMTLKQDPIWTLQGHILYNFKAGFWLAVDGGYGRGGGTVIGGTDRNILQENTRLGATLAIPLARRHSLKLSYISGLSTRLGADFDTILLGYQYRWGGGF